MPMGERNPCCSPGEPPQSSISEVAFLQHIEVFLLTRIHQTRSPGITIEAQFARLKLVNIAHLVFSQG